MRKFVALRMFGRMTISMHNFPQHTRTAYLLLLRKSPFRGINAHINRLTFKLYHLLRAIQFMQTIQNAMTCVRNNPRSCSLSILVLSFCSFIIPAIFGLQEPLHSSKKSPVLLHLHSRNRDIDKTTQNTNQCS